MHAPPNIIDDKLELELWYNLVSISILWYISVRSEPSKLSKPSHISFDRQLLVVI